MGNDGEDDEVEGASWMAVWEWEIWAWIVGHDVFCYRESGVEIGGWVVGYLALLLR